MSVPYAEINDIRLYYEEMGDPAGTPFVLMHAASSSIDDPDFSWSEMMPLFSGAGYRAIHIEHRGHGRTNNPAGKITYEMIASDVCAFIEQLALGSCHIGAAYCVSISSFNLTNRTYIGQRWIEASECGKFMNFAR